MQRSPHLAVAILFVAATALYSATWMYAVRQEPSVHLGVDLGMMPADAGGIGLQGVKEGGPAARAGLRAGDRVVSLGGKRLESTRPLYEALLAAHPGDRLRLGVARPGMAESFPVEVTLAAWPRVAPSLSRRVADEILGSFPILFLVVSAAVLLLRPDDRNAWLLAFVFASFIATAPLFEIPLPRGLRHLALGYKVVFQGAAGGLFAFFFSVFPASGALDRRLPWLKWLWLVAGLAVSLPLAVWAAAAGSTEPLARWALGLDERLRRPALNLYYFGGYGLGLLSLVTNAAFGPIAVRRKSVVILWGTAVGFIPSLVLYAAAVASGKAPYEFPFWVWAPCIMVLAFMPLSFAYAVVKHRVLEIPTLLRRSARYLLVQRGSYALVVGFAILDTWLFARFFAAWLRPWTEAALPVALTLGTAFGTVLVWTGTLVQRRLRERIDRAFFRRAYDARLVLEDLADKARAATSRADLASLLEHHVGNALLPQSLAVYLEAREGILRVARGSVPDGADALPSTVPALAELAARAQPREVEPREWSELSVLARLQPDCLVPILGRDHRLTGLLVLGPRLSDEPYSREDKRLLASVASQAGVALESIQLAEQVAERMEAERRADHELELAKQVQARFLPEAPPTLRTLECAGRCVQARAVGGDYYDFLELGPGLVGLALADISGKGLSAALLMANLQASLRSRTAEDLRDLSGQLRSVNHLLYRSTEANRFATLFLGVYDDDERRLTYVNCGHNPPLVLRADRSVERLCPTAPALGLLEDWTATAATAVLASGDLLALYTDGVTEAWSQDGEEFGEERLLAVLRESRSQSAAGVVGAVIAAVSAFAQGEQADDLTLVVARSR